MTHHPATADDNSAGAPARTLFTDDSAANIDAAARLGLRTHLFDGTPGLRAALRDLGVPVARSREAS